MGSSFRGLIRGCEAAVALSTIGMAAQYTKAPNTRSMKDQAEKACSGAGNNDQGQGISHTCSRRFFSRIFPFFLRYQDIFVLTNECRSNIERLRLFNI
jgi:hypothetical protein